MSAAAAPGLAPGALSAPQVPHAAEPAASGPESGQTAALRSAPLFQLGRVQYALPSPLLHLGVAASRLVLCLAGDATALVRLVWIDLDNPACTHEASVPIPPVARAQRMPDANEVRVFVGPQAEHVLIAAPGYTWYWTPTWARARLLPRLSSHWVTAVAWGVSDRGAPPVPLPPAPTGRTWIWTPPMLLGTARGELWEAACTAQISMSVAAPPTEARADFFDRLARKTAGTNEYAGPVERGVRRVFALHDAQRVAGMALVHVARRAYVVVATATRLYEFSGACHAPGEEARGVYEALFQPYRDTLQTHLKIELPSEDAHAALVCTAPPRCPAHRRALLWHTGAGLFHAELNLEASPPDGFVTRTGLLAYPDAYTPPFVARTAYHYVLVYADRVACVNALDEHVAWDAPLALADTERVRGLSIDPALGTCWVYTDRSMYELLAQNEDRDMWRILLARGAYDDALAYAPDPASAAQVHACRADALLAQGHTHAAAAAYARTSERTLDEVVLALVAHGAHDALPVYVQHRLETLAPTERVARLLLATWLVELRLHALHRWETAAAAHAHPDAAGECEAGAAALRALLTTYATALDPPTTYALLAHHGRDDLWLAYAEAIHDTHQVLTHWVRRGAYTRALDTLAAQSDAAPYYAFAAVLMRHAPRETVACWMRAPATLAPTRLIPAVLQHRPARGATHYGIVYLQHATQHTQDAAVHNLLVTLLAQRAADADEPAATRTAAHDALQQCIEGATTQGHVFFDRNYALRTCARYALRDACVRLHAQMDRHENAVHLALEAGDVDLACRCAELAADAPVRKALWLRCAEYVIRTQHGIEGAMAFLQRTALLTFEDILPLFPDFVVIDGFKDEICDTLHTYVARIDALKHEMDHTTFTAERIQHDLERLATRALRLDADQPCEACGAPLLQRPTYLFPCYHGYHATCLTQEVTQHLPPRLLRRLLQLQEELSVLAGPPEGEDHPAHTPPPHPSPSFSRAQPWTLDTLRERVRPQAIVEAITTGLSAGVASGRRVLAPLDPFAEHGARTDTPRTASEPPSSAAPPRADVPTRQRLAQAEAVRREMHTIVAGTCPVCTLSVQHLTLPFTQASQASTQAADDEAEEAASWAV